MDIRYVGTRIMGVPSTRAHVRMELLELWEALRALDVRGIREEWNDVCVMALHYLWGLGVLPGWFPIVRGFGLSSAHKFEARLQVWEWIFKRHGVPFKREFLRFGGNFMRDMKVVKCLILAGYAGEVNWVAVNELRAQWRAAHGEGASL